MKIKHWVIVSLILAIVTMGAVSASDDVLAADNMTEDSVEEIPAEEVLGESSTQPAVGLEPEDFNASIKDTVDLEDENDNVVAQYTSPQVAAGRVDVYMDLPDRPVYSSAIVSGQTVKITTDNLQIVSPGTYPVSLVYVPSNGGENLTLAQNTLKAKIYTDKDFSILYDTWIISKNDNIVSHFSYPVAGTLTLYVNGTPRCTRDVRELNQRIYVFLSDLNITRDGIYNVSAKFKIAATSKEIEVGNVTAIDVNNVNWDEDEYVRVYSYADILDVEEYFIDIDSNGDYVNGTVTVYIDGTLRFNKSVPYSDENIFYEVYTVDLGIYDNISLGEHNVTVIYMKDNKEKHEVVKEVQFYAEPIFDPVHEISLAEKGYFPVVSTKDLVGTATLYYALGESHDEKGDQYSSAKFVNGVALIPLNSSALGEYYFILNVTGYDVEPYVKVVVKKNSPGLSLSLSASSIYVGDSVTVKFTGPSANETVYITLDGRLWKSVPFTEGALSETISGLTLGTHNVNVFFDDRSNFYSNTVYVTVKEVPKPPVKVDKVKLTVKKVKIKKSAKKLVLKATLKINGKNAKGKVVKFKFNKKTYKAKTNSKGIAKKTLKKKVIKKLKKGKTYTLKATYNKYTVKTTVKVKG